VTGWSRALLVVVALVVVATAAGCSSSTRASFTPDFPKPPSYDQLVATAALDPCPASTAAHPHKSLPDLTLPCLGRGPAVHLSGLSGAPTVVNIWGSWCGPCQAETRYLSSVYDAAKSKVRFLGVDTEDDPKSALDFAPHVSPPMHYPQVVDKDKKLLIALNQFSAVPTTVFVEATGRIAHITHTPYRDEASLRADIRRYLGVTV